jgi:hypothetical protein
LETTKALYKELVVVAKDAATGKFKVSSHVYEISAATDGTGTKRALPVPTSSRFNRDISRLFLVLNRGRNNGKLLSYKWENYW